MAYSDLFGLARGKGAAWAEHVYRQVGRARRSRAWPQTSKMHDIARRVVAAEIHKFDRRLDDPRLADRLALACAEGAAARWATLTRRYR